MKREPESEIGVRVMVVPVENGAEQVDPLVPQEIPTGDEEMVPHIIGVMERVRLIGVTISGQRPG